MQINLSKKVINFSKPLKNGLNTTSVKIGERLNHFLKFAKISRGQFAETLKVTHTTIANYLQGKTEPSFANLQSIYEEGCNITWLITGKGDMFSDTPKGRALREIALPQKPISPEELTTKYSNLSFDSDDAELAAFMRDMVMGLANAKEEGMKNISQTVHNEPTTVPQLAPSTTPLLLNSSQIQPNVVAAPNKFAHLYRKMKMVKNYLTTKNHTLNEWLKLLQSYNANVSMEDVLGWEGVLQRQEHEQYPPMWFWDFLEEHGINPDFVLIEEFFEPFLPNEAGKVLKEKVAQASFNIAES